MVTIIDLEISNLQSVTNAFSRVGVSAEITHDVAAVDAAHVLVLPGVGAFDRAMARLRDTGLTELVRRHALERRRPLVGICLGMQLLADRSDENGLTDGLGIIRGHVRRLEAQPPVARVPNIGWMPVAAAKPSPVFPSEVDGLSFYHVHSYHMVCEDPSDIAATADFGDQRIVSAVARANVFGMQFHPEKSQDAGLTLLASLLTHLHAPAN